MVDKVTNEVADFPKIIEDCQDIFMQKRKTIQSIALITIYASFELPAMVSALQLGDSIESSY